MLVFWFYQANILNTVKILVLLKNTRNFWLIHAALVSQKPVTGKLFFFVWSSGDENNKRSSTNGSFEY